MERQERSRRAPSALHSFPIFLLLPGQRRTGPGVFVPAGGSRGLPGSHGLGMCSLLHFYHNNSLINSRAAAGGGGRDMCKRGGGARGPARAKGRRSLSTAPPRPPRTGAAWPQEIPGAPLLQQNMFLGSDFQ